MADIPDDLTSVGTHHGNQPPTKSGQTVRSPEGPDPSGGSARPSPALFQVLRDPAGNRVEVYAHSPRAVVPDPNEGEEEGQYRTVDALRKGLAEVDIEGWTAVFEDAEAERVLVETDVTPDHAWIGQERFPAITFFADEEAANTYAREHDLPAPNQ